MTMVAPPKLEPTYTELRISTNGTFLCRGAAAKLFSALDARFRDAAVRAGAEQHCFPTLIAERTLSDAGYFQSFPGCAFRVDGPAQRENYFLSPAVCYHCYELLAGSEIGQPMLLTCCGRCFRNDSADGSHLWEFTMREVVFLGSLSFVREQRESWMRTALRWAKDLGLEAVTEAANDPFFGAENRGKKLLQRVKQLKYELRAPGLAGANMAIASFNLHEQFFTKAFNITLRDEEQAFSGCAAFGLERWTMALLACYPGDEALKRVESLR
jgi:seryl-tRNA synthetase